MRRAPRLRIPIIADAYKKLKRSARQDIQKQTAAS
jgi:hypothetical protein